MTRSLLSEPGSCHRLKPSSKRPDGGANVRGSDGMTGMARKSVGIKDVAAHAGVSIGSVSHVLNHPERVSAATQERVSAAIEELGFVRNGSAARLRANSSNAAGLVVLDAGNPFFAEIERGVEGVMTQHGFIVMI